MIINVLTPIDCEVDIKDLPILKPLLQYKKEFWKRGQYRTERKVYEKDMFAVNKDKTKFSFLRGFKNRVDEYCKMKGVPIAWENDTWEVPCKQEPDLPGIEFRDYQQRLIRAAITKQRGVIKSPTGSGKTIIALGIMSCIPEDCNILFLCHTISLITQTAKKLKEFGFKDVGVVGGGKNRIGRITVATMQSFSKIYKKYADKFQVIFVDECHHVSGFDTVYAKILKYMIAPMRIGLTATLPVNTESKLALEGHIGPLLDEFTMEEAQDKEVLAKPKVKLIKLPYNHDIRALSRYSNQLDDDGNILIGGVVQKGIVDNRSRNRAIIKTAKNCVKLGKSVLIIINLVEHGNNLVDMAKTVFDFNIPFVHGVTEGDARDKIQRALTDKDIKCVISTSVWKEGVDIPTLDVLINGAGGKSELATLQTIGRGLRKTEDKNDVLIYDFFDPSHRFLVSHFGERVCLYMDMGWM